jgi:hypothetical protein
MCVGQLSIDEMNGVFTALGGSAIELIVPGSLHMRWFGCGWDFAVAAFGGAWYRRCQHRQIATDDHGERCLPRPLLGNDWISGEPSRRPDGYSEQGGIIVTGRLTFEHPPPEARRSGRFRRNLVIRRP